MLKNTFQHIPGIGNKSEADMWSSGVMYWEDLKTNKLSGFSDKKLKSVKEYIETSQQHLKESKAPSYFYENLPSKLHWRFFPEFINSAVYLDIETDGQNVDNGTITTIALYDGQNIFHYTNGYNLDVFPTDILKYNLIITYNGKSFDIPFIEKYFGIKIDHAQIDLRHVLASLGFKGGLKGCEKALGIDRQDLDGVDGYMAVLLWDDYTRNNNEKALETLLAYNIEDVLNLDYLMITAYNMKLQETPFKNNQLQTRPVPKSPFKADINTVKSLMANMNHNSNSWYR